MITSPAYIITIQGGITMKYNISEYYVLEQLNKYAKTLSGPNNNILSAENFLLAVVNILLGEPVPEYISPLPKNMKKELSAICECYNISYLDTKERLQPVIKEVYDPVYDEFKMAVLLENADILRKGYNCTYPSPVFLLEAILQFPTDPIKECRYSEKKYPIENSLALEIYYDLLKQANTACGKNDGCVTAEKYLWTICNAVNNLSEDDLGTPIKDITCAILEKSEEVFETNKISPKILQPLLADYILNTDDPTEGKARFMFYKQDAIKELTKKNLKYYSPEVLLNIILNDFSDVHKDIFSKHNALYKLQNNALNQHSSENTDNEYDCFVDCQSDVI